MSKLMQLIPVYNIVKKRLHLITKLLHFVYYLKSIQIYRGKMNFFAFYLLKLTFICLKFKTEQKKSRRIKRRDKII